MNTFTDIIHEVLTDFEYKHLLKNVNNASLYKSKRSLEEQYYLISDYKQNDFAKIEVQSVQQAIYTQLQISKYNTLAMAKNTSWLIGLEVDSKYENIKNKILDTEEDPYFFKKMVCPYNKDEIEEFISLKNKSENIISYIQDIVSNISRFNKFHEGKDCVYDFAARLMIKLPIIEIKIDREKKMNNLSKIIEKCVAGTNISDMYQFLLNDIDEKINMIETNDIAKLRDLYYGKSE